MSVFSAIENFFKSVGSHIKGAFVTLFGSQTGEALAAAAEQFVKTELGAIAVTVVQGLESAAVAPADKKNDAFQQIGQQLEAQGKSFPSAAINFAIEFALQIVRGAAAAKA